VSLEALRESLRGAGNAERAGLFSCAGCVGWCCREGFNAMRATPPEAEAILALLEERGEAGAALEACAAAVERFRLDATTPRTYTCPFLTAGNLCGVHAAKPLGCVTFTPVRDGGCDQDGERLHAAVADLEGEDLPLPLAILAAYGVRNPTPAAGATGDFSADGPASGVGYGTPSIASSRGRRSTRGSRRGGSGRA
jgi:Fe-S-cluster containining protein